MAGATELKGGCIETEAMRWKMQHCNFPPLRNGLKRRAEGELNK